MLGEQMSGRFVFDRPQWGSERALVQQPSDSSSRCCGHEAEWVWMIHDLLAHVRTHDEQALLEQPGIDGPPFDRHGLESLTTSCLLYTSDAADE